MTYKDSNNLRMLLDSFKIDYKTIINNDDTITIEVDQKISFTFNNDRSFSHLSKTTND